LIAVVGILFLIAYIFYIRAALQKNFTYRMPATMSTMISTQKHYFSSNGKYGTLKELGDAQYIDSVMASGKISGYQLELTASMDKWHATLIPTDLQPTATFSYYADQNGIVRYTQDRSKPDANSPPLPRKYMEYTFFDWLIDLFK